MTTNTAIPTSGLEDFEEKMEALGDKEVDNEEGNDSWINNLVREYAKVKKETEEEIKREEEAGDVDLEGLEPPLLDPTWGLGGTNGTRSRRAVDDGTKGNTDDDGSVAKAASGSGCMVEVWRCLSGVLEAGVMHLDTPGGIMR